MKNLNQYDDADSVLDCTYCDEKRDGYLAEIMRLKRLVRKWKRRAMERDEARAELDALRARARGMREALSIAVNVLAQDRGPDFVRHLDEAAGEPIP